ncbi:cytochrome c [Elizabethkingia bruuniana]|uniref:Cytochrome c n=2 Tax=Elizabethkingia TaxID=308865 RepID=A0A7T7ZY11_9FLAO|nr:cbb3-type cytochrome c oxidase subunit II [Elizabethkingia bruuniana]KGO09903.1 cytochrome C oxidase [Elizabethkingia miricola]MCT3940450.1 cytochrome c [Elizabethkingia anophelis]MCT4193634.1 cytochrome c [Elizabethkingia anophelis]MDV2458277.1 cytochrome-c oxidase [Elizabethkingia anophelis]MDV3527995.1 cytochrome-c oxidase [Elizabethkingia anophelis]
MDFFSDHKKLFSSALAFFLFLTLFICIFPALNNQKVYQPLQGSKPLTEEESRGKSIYIREGCVACHTQQVRNVDMDQVFGNRPSLAVDYARNKRLNLFQNTATLMGTERTGPDLTNIGARQSSKDWQYSHLFNPRSVVPQSIMPSYKWLFLVKDQLDPGDKEISLPDAFRKGIKGKIVPSKDASDLVAYLLSLKQTELPKSIPAREFLYKKEEKKAEGSAGGDNLPDGEALFIANCATCHQATGEGVPGAFPPLKGDKVVLGDNLELYVTIIMKGYNGLAPQFGEMPAVGTNANFKPEDVAALINHERTSWGNNGKKVTVEEVKIIMDKIK